MEREPKKKKRGDSSAIYSEFPQTSLNCNGGEGGREKAWEETPDCWRAQRKASTGLFSVTSQGSKGEAVLGPAQHNSILTTSQGQLCRHLS